jgi:16S rRNA (adenine1518-N6/adenine1519-N6)-dimethyltransferase
VTPKKSLGQHFLIDGNIIRKIVGSLTPKEGDTVIEIGPGTGALTASLHKLYPDMLAVEVDPRSIELLKKDIPGLNILHQDVLDVEWGKIGEQKSEISERGEENREQKTDNRKLSVIGNLPYYITSPILFHVLDYREYFREAVFMMQKEVAERLVAKPRTKDYGILSVQTQLLCRVELLFLVPPTVFVPPPKVDSAVVKLHFDGPPPDVELSYMKKVVRMAFNQRRKKLSNAIKELLTEENRPRVAHWLDKRAEELTPGEFVDLCKRLVVGG